jgi:GntR family transcriptional repressor for pyruvate dehydrogenase complex
VEITKLSKRKIYEEIADQIKQHILNGKLTPGQKLPSAKELAESYQVGRSTIREALSALKAMGLIVIRQGEGSYVQSTDLQMPVFDSLLINKKTLIDLIGARKALEVANASLAAENRTKEDLIAFQETLTLMSNHLGNEEIGKEADMMFHQTLANATHNPIMVQLLDTISSQMEAAIQETRRIYMYGDESVSKQLWIEHKEVYDAILAKEPDLAQEKMKQHLFHVEQLLKPFLQ